MKSPKAKMLPFTVNLIAEKSGLPTSAAISGVSRSFVSAATTAANAPPTTTPTAMSTTLPRRTNCVNPLGMDILQRCDRRNSEFVYASMKSGDKTIRTLDVLSLMVQQSFVGLIVQPLHQTHKHVGNVIKRLADFCEHESCSQSEALGFRQVVHRGDIE